MSSEGIENVHDKPRLIVVWYGFGALLLLLVAILSLIPAPDTGVNDKLSHLLTYFLLGGWFGVLAANRPVLAWTFAGLVAYGGAIELLQGTTDYRFAEWADLLADAVGTGLGLALYFTPLRQLLLFVDRQLAAIFLR